MINMHDEKMPDDVVLVIPCLEYPAADKHVAAIAMGKRVKGKFHTPNWQVGHGTAGYTSAPGQHWRAATPDDAHLTRYIPAGASGKIGYLKDEDE